MTTKVVLTTLNVSVSFAIIVYVRKMNVMREKVFKLVKERFLTKTEFQVSEMRECARK